MKSGEIGFYDVNVKLAAVANVLTDADLSSAVGHIRLARIRILCYTVDMLIQDTFSKVGKFISRSR